MNLGLTVVETVAPVFALAGIGLAWVRLGLDYPVEFVTRLVMNIAIPCLIFEALVTTTIAPAALTEIALAAGLGYVALTGLFFAGLRATGGDTRSLTAPLANGNTGNLGLPLALFAFGDIGLGYALVVFAVSGLSVFILGVWVTSGRSGAGRVLLEPMVLATLAAVVVLSTGWQIPEVASRTLSLAGQISIPLMLITLGVAIARLDVGRLAAALWLTALRFAVCFAVAWGLGTALGLSDTAFAVLVLQFTTPVAVTSFLIAERYKVDSTAVAGLVFISTLLSLITIPLTLTLLL